MIIVTGASRGLGAAIIERLNEKGHETHGLARSVDSACPNLSACDVSDYEQVKSVATRLKRSDTLIDGLINAAGVASMNLALTTPPSTTKHLINTNLLGTIYCCQLFAPLMVRRKQGTILNFSTIAVALALKGESVYAASKAGVEGFSRAFAREMADFNVNVNCIAPGPIDTDLIRGISDKQIARIVQQQIIPKQFDANAVCDLVELMIDQRATSLSGQVLHIGGA